MPVEIGGQVFAERYDDVLTRCDCGGKTIREMRRSGEMVKAYRRCKDCGLVYFNLKGDSGLIVAGIDVMTRPGVQVFR